MAAKIRNLQQWCKRQCDGYRDVEVTNMTSSFKSGLAFCAIIHRYRPDLIDYDSLSKENVYDNNKLAFDVAQERLDIAALLDPEDMVTMTVPDKLCIVTYVSQYYNYFRDKNPDGGPDVKQCRAPTKRASTTQPPASAPGAKKSPQTKTTLSDRNQGSSPASTKTHATDNNQQGEPPAKRGTYGDTCHYCKKKVYLMERHIEGSRLYHRRCFRDHQRSQRSPPAQTSAFQYPTSTSSTDTKTRSTPYQPPSRKELPTNSKAAEQNRGTASKYTTSYNTEPKATGGNNQISLVKMLHGGPTPYGSTNSNDSQVPNKSFNRTSVPYNNSKVNSSSTTAKPPAFSDNYKPNSVTPNSKDATRGSTVSQRASLFDDGPKPRFGVSAQPQQPKSNVNTTNSLSSNAKDLFPSAKDFSAEPRKAEPMEVDKTFPTANHSTSDRNNSQPTSATVYRLHPGSSGNTSGNTSASKETEVKTSLLANLANIRKKTTPENDTTTGGTSSILKHSKATAETQDISSSRETPSHKSILKPVSPRQSFDASSSEHRPILKSRLTEEPETTGTSPSRSILRKSDGPSDSGQKSIGKSILKSKEPVEIEIEIDNEDSKPRSILKHLGDSHSGTSDTSTASTRSILKHDLNENAGHESRSILKNTTGGAPAPAWMSSAGSEDSTGSLLQKSRPPSTSVTPTPRAQVKVADKASPATSGSGQKVSSYSPMGIVFGETKESPKAAPRKSARKSSSPNLPQKPWEKPVPQARKSAGTPSVSSAPSHKSVGGTAVNNFSAFNLQDSLLLHDKTGDHSKPRVAPARPSSVPKVGVSIDKGKAGQNKSSWQMETEARTGVKPGRNAPPRPSAPPNASKPDDGKQGTKRSSDEGSKPDKPSWQLEAERRQAARKGKYEDPEHKHKYGKKDTLNVTGGTSDRKSADLTHSSDKVTVQKPDKPSRHSIGNPLDSTGSSKNQFKPPSKGSSDSNLPSIPTRPPPPRLKDVKSPPHDYEIIKETTGPCTSPTNADIRLSRTPAFRVSDSPESSPEAKRSTTENRSEFYVQINESEPKKKILPEVNFTFGDHLNSPSSSSDSSSRTFDLPSGDHSWIQQRPLPMPPGTIAITDPPKRTVNAEARISDQEIAQELEELDKQLRVLEENGRSMEDTIRAVSEDQMDEGELMTQWFETVSKKNDLVRRESELMYKQKQQELEDFHTDVEYELRLLMSKPDHEKTASDRVRENTLIAELLDTVDQRNNIVDNMEEDRIRYIAEDREIADMMAKTVLGDSDKKKKKKAEKGKKGAKYSPDKNAKQDSSSQAGKERKLFRKSVGSGGL